ncbi:MAG: XRE family transcriptional regulator [Chloroflexi bacterium]|nr:XRE family transcriptional regulator [Chloroflexota bacterium]
MRETVNPEWLTLARELRGMTQLELSKQSRITQSKISRYEGGITDVDANDLTTLSHVLEFPAAFFCQTGHVYGAESTEIFNRRRKRVPARDLKRIHAFANLYRVGGARLSYAFEQVDKAEIPIMRPGDFENVSDIAEAVRSLWNMPNGPVQNLVAWLEYASCLVHSFDFEIDKIDEVVHWVSPDPAVVLVNSSAPADRTRFSLAHALGHLVMHRDIAPYPEIEKEADEFAAAFLMPERDILGSLAPVTIQHMLEMKQVWRVSMATLIRRARDLGVVTQRRYSSLFQQLSRLGYRKREPRPFLHESPRLVKLLVDRHRSHLGFSNQELAEMLMIRTEDFHSWYATPKVIALQSDVVGDPDPDADSATG